MATTLSALTFDAAPDYGRDNIQFSLTSRTLIGSHSNFEVNDLNVADSSFHRFKSIRRRWNDASGWQFRLRIVDATDDIH